MHSSNNHDTEKLELENFCKDLEALMLRYNLGKQTKISISDGCIFIISQEKKLCHSHCCANAGFHKKHDT